MPKYHSKNTRKNISLTPDLSKSNETQKEVKTNPQFYPPHIIVEVQVPPPVLLKKHVPELGSGK
jgi:hypothetical protein